MKMKRLKQSKIDRIWHDYRKWEGFNHGLYNENKDDGKMERINQSKLLLKDPISLMISMYGVIDQWKYETEQFLSNQNSNRQAWLGQAACCLNHGASESETRTAWNQLSINQMERANMVADAIILEWENRYENQIKYEYPRSGKRKDTFYL